MLYNTQWEKPVTTETWRDVLLKAADLIDAGWCQGILHYRESNGRNRYCAAGAVAAAVNAGEVGPINGSGLEALARLQVSLGGACRLPIIAWKDTLPADTGAATVSAKL